MKQHNNQSLKIGRITSEVEATFNAHFAFNPNVYFQQEHLDAFVSAHPDRYLRIMEEVSAMIRHPDLVCFVASESTFYYFRLYAGKEGFRTLGVRICLRGHPNAWCISEVKWYNDEFAKKIMKKGEFRRVSEFSKKKKINKD